MSRIAFDLDDVLGNHTDQLIRFHERVYGGRKRYSLEMFHHYDLHLVFKISPDEMWGRLNRFYESPEFEAISPIPGSQECIKEIVAGGDVVSILTGRSQALARSTRAWSKKYFPDVYQVLIAGELLPGPENLKGKICHNRGIGLLVEDSLIQALDCASQCGVALLDRPWNRNPSVRLPSSITRVSTWAEVSELAKKY